MNESPIISRNPYSADTAYQYLHGLLAESMAAARGPKLKLIAIEKSDEVFRHDGFAIEQTRGGVVIRSDTLRGLLYSMAWVRDCLLSASPLRSRTLESPFELRITDSSGALCSQDVFPNHLPENWHLSIRETHDVYALRQNAFDLLIIRFRKLCRIMLELGFNAVFVSDAFYLVNFDSVGDGLAVYARDSRDRRLHDEYRAAFRALATIAREYHHHFIVYAQEFFTTDAMQKYAGPYCPLNDNHWGLMAAKYAELFELLPGAYGVMANFTDYSNRDPTLRCMYPFNHSCPACAGIDPFDRMRIVVGKMRDIIVGRCGKKYIHRTWDFRPVSCRMHNDPGTQRRLFEGLDLTDVYPSIKLTAGDFKIGRAANPALGAVPRQVLEFQNNLEHNAYCLVPIYAAGDHGAGLRAAAACGAGGVNAWFASGGEKDAVRVPFFHGFEKWTEANHYAFSRQMWDTAMSPREAARRWGERVYGRGCGPAMAAILRLSRQASPDLYGFREIGFEQLKAKLSEADIAAGTFRNPLLFHWMRFYYRNRNADPVGQLPLMITDVRRAVRDIRRTVPLFDRMIRLFAGLRRKIKDADLYLNTLQSLSHAKKFAELAAAYRETFLRYHCKFGTVKALTQAAANLEAVKRQYDEHYGLFITQEIDLLLEDLKRR